MKMVYVVTTGSYSDYRIRGVYSSINTAERYKNVLSDSNEIEEWEVDKTYSPIEKGYSYWLVTFNKGGDVAGVYMQDALCDDCSGKFEVLTTGVEYAKYSPEKIGRMTISVWAKTKEHAIKSASEIRFQVLANKTFMAKANESKWGEYLELGSFDDFEKGVTNEMD